MPSSDGTAVLYSCTHPEPASNDVCENELPGAPEREWDVNGAGSGDIEGDTDTTSG